MLSGILRWRFYELFANFHLLLVAAVAVALYLHNRTKVFAPPTVYLFSALCIYVVTGASRFAQLLYRNVRYGWPLNRASVRTITFKRSDGKQTREIPLSDAVHVHVRLTRAWKPHAGQFVYLCIPGVSYTSFAQLHPFYVAWWYCEGSDDYVVFIVQKQRGFTDRLFLRRGNGLDRELEMRAVVEGPYGKELELDLYGTVVLFATGIGIAGQLPYVSQLLAGYQNCEVKTRRITLFWQVDSESRYLAESSATQC